MLLNKGIVKSFKTNQLSETIANSIVVIQKNSNAKTMLYIWITQPDPLQSLHTDYVKDWMDKLSSLTVWGKVSQNYFQNLGIYICYLSLDLYRLLQHEI